MNGQVLCLITILFALQLQLLGKALAGPDTQSSKQQLRRPF